MRGRMTEAPVPAVRAIRSERGGQRLAVDADAAVALAGARQLDAGRLAHNVHHVQRTADLHMGPGMRTRVRIVCMFVTCGVYLWVRSGLHNSFKKAHRQNHKTT